MNKVLYDSFVKEIIRESRVKGGCSESYISWLSANNNEAWREGKSPYLTKVGNARLNEDRQREIRIIVTR